MTGLELPLLTLALMVAASFVAGWVDSVVGGGGLIQLPSLLIGLPADTPVPTISGTNKLPSSLGTAAAALTYLRRVPINLLHVVPLIAGAASGSAVGANLVQLLDRRAFNPLVLAAIVGGGWYVWRRPELGLVARSGPRGWSAAARLLGIGLLVGVWDGFMGPGTGTFFLILLVAGMRMEFLPATALTKLANLTTNVAALLVLGFSGHVLWGLGLTMGAANLCGGLLGARTALKQGNGFVRRVFLVVVCVLGAKVAWDTIQGLL